MPRFKIFLEYDGTRYSGWQIQKNARTVQGEITNAVAKIFPSERFEIMGAGRTDAGVHALEQVAHLDVQTMLAPEIIRMRLNDVLPADICVIEIEKTARTFHARHDAVARSYLYQISRRRTAFGKRFVWWVKDPLDVRLMRQTGSRFKGMNDFRSFTADDPDEKSTSVLIEELEIDEVDSIILIRVVGSHFLWKMVRQMVGVMVEAGRGKMDPGEVDALLSAQSQKPAATTAPPSGLYLERVYYKGDARLTRLTPLLAISDNRRPSLRRGK